MSISYDLTQLDAHSFEHMVNSLALSVLGKGVTGLAQGADGGRDGLLMGEAPYPTAVDRWNGTWYIQSKFHKPHLSKDAQKWLIAEVKKELAEFETSSLRVMPDIWIIATNIEPSGTPRTGAFDAIKEAVEDSMGAGIKFDIWGGSKILDFLSKDPGVSAHFGHFLTPGHVLSAMYQQIGDATAQISPIISHLVLDQFNDQIYTKLEQAGGTGPKPKIHELFVDLPAQPKELDDPVFVLETLVSTAANVHKPTAWARFGDGWRAWATHPQRARAIILKGGPGQGKSTAGQFFCQIQRAALLLESDSIITLPDTRETAKDLLAAAEVFGFKPLTPRIPVSIELKDFASWHGARTQSQSKGILAYLCEKIASKIDQIVDGKTLKRAFSTRSWFFNFDGLDEVPNDVKDQVADEVNRFVNVVLPQLDSDALVLCTTRPQGYSGQFKELNATTLDLAPLPADIAIRCAEGVIRFATGHTDAENCLATLRSAIESPQVRELMTTPLQSHIMAIVVKDGGRPPEKRWELFENFYLVMKRRESLKNFADARIAQLLRDNSVLLKAVHARLGISLHSKAEKSLGAETTLSRSQFEVLTRQTAAKYEDDKIDVLVETLMEATVQRLVFVSTPESSSSVRFDVRQLQEFFAAEFLYAGVTHQQLKNRLDVIGGDSHWREVMHFAISALVVTSRPTELAVAISTLKKLDDDDTSIAVRGFRRRVGAGSLMALRLLHEGVLEQDRAVRMQFREVLVPMYGMMEDEVTDSLCTVRHSNTMAWLLNSMIDALIELNETEQINAAAVLAQRLPCTHVRRREASERIFSGSPGYLDGVYNLILGDSNYPFMTSQKSYRASWFTLKTLELLISETPPAGIRLALPLRYARSAIKLKTDLDEFDFPENIKSAIWILVDPAWRVRDRPETAAEVDINEIAVIPKPYTWTNKTIDKEISQLDWDTLAPASQIINKTITFWKDQTLSSLRTVLEIAIKYDLSELLAHSTISNLIPLDIYATPMSVLLRQLSDLTQADFNRLLHGAPLPGGIITPPYEILRYPRIRSAEQFRTLATAHPQLALASWIGTFGFAEKIEDFSAELYREVALEIIQNNPGSMLSLFGGWGVIALQQPELFALIRPQLRAAATYVDTLLTPDKVTPFALDLPHELVFLPHVAQSILDELARTHIDGKSEGKTKALLQDYKLDSETLRVLSSDKSILLKYRAAALACSLALAASKHDGNSEKIILEDLAVPLVEILKQEVSTLLIDAICYTFTHIDSGSEGIKELVGEILIYCRDEYRSRHSMQYLIAHFRERSSAPVSNKDVLESWLEE